MIQASFRTFERSYGVLSAGRLMPPGDRVRTPIADAPRWSVRLVRLILGRQAVTAAYGSMPPTPHSRSPCRTRPHALWRERQCDIQAKEISSDLAVHACYEKTGPLVSKLIEQLIKVGMDHRTHRNEREHSELVTGHPHLFENFAIRVPRVDRRSLRRSQTAWRIR
jgi:hypothetical protein